MTVLTDHYDAASEAATLRQFNIVFACSQFFGALCIILMAVWMGAYDGGFGWTDSPAQQFHYHPLFMTVGMIFLYGEAITVFRVFRHERKVFTKTLHGSMHCAILLCAVIALKAVFDSHDNAKPPIANLYTLHSWFGLTAVICFCLQGVVGFGMFVFPSAPMNVRAAVMPYHRLVGATLFALATVTALMGLSERASWRVKCWQDRCAEGQLVNAIGVSMLIYALLVLYLVGTDKYRRRPLPEEMSLQQLTNDDE